MFFLYTFELVNLIYMAVAIVPALILLKYIYDLDQTDPEPPGLLVKLLFFGALAIIPAAILERVAASFLSGYQSAGKLYYFLDAFFGVALIEEGCKLIALKIGSFNDPAFDHQFDGIVYAVFVSLGFAIIENIMYVYSTGLSSGLLRALTSLPGHMCFAVPMGIFYAKAKRNSLHHKPIGGYMFLALLESMIFHGAYDYSLMVGDMMSFVLILIVIYLILFLVVKKEEEKDRHF